MAVTGKSGVSSGVEIKASVIGEDLITATTTASAQSIVGISAVGAVILGAATTAAAQDALGGGTVGKQIFAAATTAQVTSIVGAGGSFTGSAADIPFTPGALVHVSATNVQTAINQLDGALERVSAASIGGTAIGKAIFTAATTAAAQNLLEAGTVGLQIFKCATTAAVTNITGSGSGSSNSLIRAPGITVDGGGSVLTVGSKGYLTVPYTGTIAKWYMAADVSGSVVIDVVRGGTSIVGAGNKPTLAGDKAISASAADWTSNAITADDIIEFKVSSAATITRVNLVMKVNVT